jgi:hypothetical protein
LVKRFRQPTGEFQCSERRKIHGSVPKLHTCSGPDSYNEQKHRHSRCHYKRNSGSTSTGTNNPTRRGRGLRSNRRPMDGSRLRPLQQQRQRPPLRVAKPQRQWLQGERRSSLALTHDRRSRGEDKYKEPEARSADGGDDPVGDGDFSSRLRLGTDDGGRQPAGRSPLGSSRTSGAPTSPRRHRTGAKAGPPQNTNAALAARDILGGPPVHTARQPLSGGGRHRGPTRRARRAGADDARRRPAPHCRSPTRPQGQRAPSPSNAAGEGDPRARAEGRAPAQPDHHPSEDDEHP